MNEITVLCWTCSTPLFTTDTERLDYPLQGEMFSPLHLNFRLRPGPLNLDIFCISCGMFPFNYDPGLPGAIGRGLKIEGPDGKPLVTTIKQILLTATGQPEADQRLSGEDPVATGVGDVPAPEWPCPECGAKRRFHKKDCPLIPGGRGLNQGEQVTLENTKPMPADASVSGAETQPVIPGENPASNQPEVGHEEERRVLTDQPISSVTCPGCERQVTGQGDELHLPQCPVRKGYMPLVPDAILKGHADGLFGVVTKGPDTADAPISQEEINALEEDRLRAQSGNIPRAELKRTVAEARDRGVTPMAQVLRPDELFVPKGG